MCEPFEDGSPRMQRVPTEPVVLIDGYLQFRYAENCGAAFGIMGSGATWSRVVFVIAALVASVALFVMFARGRGLLLFALSVPLIVSGAIGNLVDRLRLGYVVDFIKFDIPDVINYPTFNIADIGITVGVILLVLDGFREGRAEKAAKAAADARGKPKTKGKPRPAKAGD